VKALEKRCKPGLANAFLGLSKKAGKKVSREVSREVSRGVSKEVAASESGST
jgi:hypothetical protein